MKAKQIREMSETDRNKKMKELKLELTKARAAAAKGGSSKIREIKKIIAKILTINKSEEALNKK